MGVDTRDIHIPRKGRSASFNTDGWLPAWEIIDGGYSFF